jgi:hypothetical protein
MRALAAAAIVTATIVIGLSAQKRGQAPAGGNGTFYVGTYAGNILIIDEASEKVAG